MLGRVVNMERPEKKPISSSTVKNRVRLRAMRYLRYQKKKKKKKKKTPKAPLSVTILLINQLHKSECRRDVISITYPH